eukprot:SAG31_NODE_5143_length_2718_cov_1.647957_4_plen_62_part_01
MRLTWHGASVIVCMALLGGQHRAVAAAPLLNDLQDQFRPCTGGVAAAIDARARQLCGSLPID